ncbi:glycoside hydrolase family 36 protein [Sphingomonas sp.]|uniref:glycoside hydrolase family 36 protein n=1 Tax=Sphingomonas sp. TaxID=28214 RepID=UPI003CC6D22F
MTAPIWSSRGVRIEIVTPLLDGGPNDTVKVTTSDGDPHAIDLAAPPGSSPQALGVRLRVSGARAYLRNGYQSWDGCYFVAAGTPAGEVPPAKAPTLGFAMTALLPAGANGEGGAVVLGFNRHDRFQTRFRFSGTADTLLIDVETLLDGTGETRAETLYLFDGDLVEPALRRWSARVAAAAPLPPRLPAKRLTGWCSWYNLYAAIDEASIREHLDAARAFRDAHRIPLDIFQIDDGFTPEMGDWLDIKPQFPDGIAPLLADAAAAGFAPGLWIAPFLVGNRSKLAAAHPDWLVGDRQTGEPLVAFHFYGEFRWHKRSEEYHVLDVTHPDAAAYLHHVLRTWTHDWGARYIKADFLYHGAEYGPERAQWREPGLSRIAVWRRGMALIRDAIGPDTILSGCGCPLWAGAGLVDAVRIGRDIGVEWHGEYSAESLLRDLQTRNHAHGVLWQADPDCILLRDHFHSLSDEEVAFLARFAAGAGGVLMTSDHLGELPPARAALFANLLREGATACDFPLLGQDGGLVVQRRRAGDVAIGATKFNPNDAAVAALDGGTLAPRGVRDA